VKRLHVPREEFEVAGDSRGGGLNDRILLVQNGMTTSGSFDLKTRADLFRKLKHDHSCIIKNWADSYAAFDFFVTALHMEDWPPVGTPAPYIDSDHDKVLKKVCSHLANGLKHFEVDADRHHSVIRTELAGSAFDPHSFSPATFQVGRLVIHLDEDAATALGMSSIDVVTLANEVLAYWESAYRFVPQKPRNNKKHRRLRS
jgi:hypothetical protein